MAVTLSPTAVEKLAQVRYARKSVTFVAAVGLKVTESSPAAKLFTGCGSAWSSEAPPQPVNNFGKPIRVLVMRSRQT